MAVPSISGFLTKIQTQSTLIINGRVAHARKGILPFNQATRIYRQVQGLSGSNKIPDDIRSKLAKIGSKLSTSALEEPLIKLARH